MGENQEENLAIIVSRVERTIAFLEGVLDIEMTLVFKEDDVIVAEMTGEPENVAVALAFASNLDESGWMREHLEFKGLEDMLEFLDRVELLIRIARIQQRGG